MFRAYRAGQESPVRCFQKRRSGIISLVHSENTSYEILVRRILHANGFRFRLHVKDLPGKPDVVLTRYKTVVFANGCLWHGHGCRRFRWPATNVDYWKNKINRTRNRDCIDRLALKNAGWKVVEIWDCNSPNAIETLVEQLFSLKKTMAAISDDKC